VVMCVLGCYDVILKVRPSESSSIRHRMSTPFSYRYFLWHTGTLIVFSFDPLRAVLYARAFLLRGASDMPWVVCVGVQELEPQYICTHVLPVLAPMVYLRTLTR
jgi:hypothetical protein